MLNKVHIVTNEMRGESTSMTPVSYSPLSLCHSLEFFDLTFLTAPQIRKSSVLYRGGPTDGDRGLYTWESCLHFLLEDAILTCFTCKNV